MSHDLQITPLFVPFQKQSGSVLQVTQKKYFVRAVISSMSAFLIAAALISYVTNHYEQKLREIKASTVTCQAAPARTATAN